MFQLLSNTDVQYLETFDPTVHKDDNLFVQAVEGIVTMELARQNSTGEGLELMPLNMVNAGFGITISFKPDTTGAWLLAVDVDGSWRKDEKAFTVRSAFSAKHVGAMMVNVKRLLESTEEFVNGDFTLLVNQ